MRVRTSAVALALAWVSVSGAGGARAGVVNGKLDVPPPPERPVLTRGFLEPVANPLAGLRPYNVMPLIVVVLEGDEKPATPPRITWNLLGESFGRPVIAAPAGSEIVIQNGSHSDRRLHALDGGKDTKLLDGVINPGGPKTFKAPDAGKVLDIGDPEAPFLRGTVVVVNTAFIGYPDEAGKFEISDVPEGNYHVKVFYKDHWLDVDQTVNVVAKGKTDINPKVPPGAFAPAPAKK